MTNFPRVCFLLFVSVFFLFITNPSNATAANKAIIVFDASGSMWGQIEGKAKIDIARNTLGSLLKNWDKDTLLGITAYGHRKKGDCNDIEAVVPLGKVNPDAIMRVINTINPKGKTPLSAAVRQAADELKYTEDKATIILISDGKESCDADPCALAKDLEAKGVDFTVHVVGFGLTADEQKQLTCLAENTGGNFYRADNAADLNKAMQSTVEMLKPAGEGKLWFEGPKAFYPGNSFTVHFQASEKFDKSAWAGVIPNSIPHGSEKRNDNYNKSYEYINKRTTGTVTLETPPKPGTWDVRLHDSDKDGFEVASVSFEVKKAKGKTWLDKKEFVTGEIMSIHFEASEGLNPNAWAGIVPSNIEHGSESVNDNHDVRWEYLAGKSKGTLQMVAPVTAGDYDIRLNDYNHDGNEFAHTSFKVVLSKGKVKIDRKKYSPGQEIVVMYNVFSKLSNKAWAGVIPSNIPHGSEETNDRHDISWEYLTAASGTLKLKAPDKPGKYDIRVHDHNQAANEIASTSFVVK